MRDVPKQVRHTPDAGQRNGQMASGGILSAIDRHDAGLIANGWWPLPASWCARLDVDASEEFVEIPMLIPPWAGAINIYYRAAREGADRTVTFTLVDIDSADLMVSKTLTDADIDEVNDVPTTLNKWTELPVRNVSRDVTTPTNEYRAAWLRITVNTANTALHDLAVTWTTSGEQLDEEG